MKWSFASVGLIVLGIIGISIIVLFEQITTGNENDYYLLKEITESAMIDSIDISHYRETGDLKIVREKFVENFTRRFAESTNLIGTNYTINYYDIIETPPKVTVSINTGIEDYVVNGDAQDYNVSNRLSAILEYIGKNTTSSISIQNGSSPYAKEKKITKTYYSIPKRKSGDEKIGTLQAIEIPEELDASNITNVEINNIEYKGIVESQGEINEAILRRSIDYPVDESFDLYFDVNYDKIITNIDNIGMNKYTCKGTSQGTSVYDCSKGTYWISWSGTPSKEDSNKDIAILRYKITWSYDEYEYAS